MKCLLLNHTLTTNFKHGKAIKCILTLRISRIEGEDVCHDLGIGRAYRDAWENAWEKCCLEGVMALPGKCAFLGIQICPNRKS